MFPLFVAHSGYLIHILWSSTVCLKAVGRDVHNGGAEEVVVNYIHETINWESAAPPHPDQHLGE